MLPVAITLDHVRAALSRPLPGVSGQMRMIPSHRRDPALLTLAAEGCRRAAVLLLLYPEHGALFTVLTARPQHLPDHPGQVSLPGGAEHEGESPEETALRESQEEIGIDPAGVEVLGRLTPVYIPPSHFCMQIVVGYAPVHPTWNPSPDEVAELLEMPIAHLFDPANHRSETRVIDGYAQHIPYFAVNEHKVWGATAIALAEFISAVEAVMAQH